ncbi:hypothetical protein EV644_15410 [Kribbella orskensis]|uniref:Uncharacterized protein n=1 Tax=Kribbella orskensis TaxID=2512216 RepID=A0ABY2B5S7_9ACTN|nr:MULTISPECIES: hypothetical protein [Kribbella]TCN27672.1 hypothetical protein EV642_15610 [Kribbella sp. VKM Ac-2500]TCO07588.1 hypothetical protein EV644_15410 [Kribbella orskensis]
MGTSNVDFRGQSFWTRDSVVSVVLALLVAELDPVTTSEPELDALLNRWALNAALCVTGAVDAALDDYATNDHVVELIRAAIPPIEGRLANDDALVEVTDPAFLRRAAAVGMAEPIDAPAALAPWVHEVLAALDQLLTGQLPEVRGGYWWVDDNGLRLTLGRDS